jgi:hypothetical protein
MKEYLYNSFCSVGRWKLLKYYCSQRNAILTAGFVMIKSSKASFPLLLTVFSAVLQLFLQITFSIYFRKLSKS